MKYLFPAVMVMVLAVPVCAGWYSSANYTIERDVLASAGNRATSAGYTLESTLGQPSVVGVSTGAAHTLEHGFWHAEEAVIGVITMSMAPSDDPGNPIDPALTPLVLDDEYILTVVVDPGMPGSSSLTLTVDYDHAYLTIEDPAIVGPGTDTVVLLVTADATTVSAGVWEPPITVTVSAAGYTPASENYAIGFVPGDGTDDNCVNVQDLLTVRANLGKEGSEIDPLSADIDGDGKVNVLDLLAVRGALGNGNGCP